MATAAPTDALLLCFLVAPAREQVRFLASLGQENVRKLRNRYLRWTVLAGAGDDAVHARLLEALDPGAYLEAEQEAELRERLSPAALKLVRERGDAEMDAFLQREDADQERFVASLAAPGLASLRDRLQRHTRDHGPGRRTRHLARMIESRLAALKDAGQGEQPPEAGPHETTDDEV